MVVILNQYYVFWLVDNDWRVARCLIPYEILARPYKLNLDLQHLTLVKAWIGTIAHQYEFKIFTLDQSIRNFSLIGCFSVTSSST